MPLDIFTILLGAVLGYTVRRDVAYAITGAVGAIAIASTVWAVTDGHGNDPAWLIAVAVAATAVALVLASVTASRRAQPASPRKD